MPEPTLPDKTRPEEEETDVERQAPVRRGAEETDIDEVPTSRPTDGSTSDIERDGGPPPGREGHDREMHERRPHRDEPI
jgi:hypothetical protein